MIQKKIGDILYVYSTTAYEITQDTDATVIKIQEECIPAYAALNASLVSKFQPINYKLFCVKHPEWADYMDDYYVHIASYIGEGTATATPNSGDEGEEITLSATPATGWELVKFRAQPLHGSVAIPVIDNKFKMPADDVRVQAEFDKIDFDITVDDQIQNGSLSAPATANLGDTVTITATPASGYVLDTLTVMCGSLELTVVNNQFTMPAGDVTVTGTFVSSGVVINPKWYNINNEEMTNPFVWSTQDYVTLNLKDVDLNIGVTDEAGSHAFLGSIVAIWESSDPSVVTINGGSSDAMMVITTQAEGTAIVTATWPAQTINGVLYAGGSASITIVIQ